MITKDKVDCDLIILEKTEQIKLVVELDGVGPIGGAADTRDAGNSSVWIHFEYNSAIILPHKPSHFI